MEVSYLQQFYDHSKKKKNGYFDNKRFHCNAC